VYRVELSRVPIARTRCWVTETDFVLDPNANSNRPADEQVIEWDPNSKISSPVRRVTLRGGNATLHCSSETVVLGSEKDSHALSYAFEPCTTRCQSQSEDEVVALLGRVGDPVTGKLGQPKPQDRAQGSTRGGGTAGAGGAQAGESTVAPLPAAPPGDPKSEPNSKAVARGAAKTQQGTSADRQHEYGTSLPAAEGAPFDVEVRLFKEPQTDPDLAGDDAVISVNRSLDPLTPLATELLSVVADVAIERAKAVATDAVKNTLQASVCRVSYADHETAKLSEPSSRAGDQTTSEHLVVFSRVCKALEAVRIQELAASSKVLARALAGDLAEFAFRYLHELNSDPFVGALLDWLQQSIAALIDGKSIGTERDFQAMLLKLGKVPVAGEVWVSATPNKLSQADWRCGIGIGLAVVRECLRRDRCTAESIESSLASELDEASRPCFDSVASLRKNWPDLGPLLARSIEVFRPPPGTAANQTAKTATNIFLDVLQRRLDDPRTEVSRGLEHIRGLINAVFDKDYVAGVTSAGGLLTDAIENYCQEQGDRCFVDATSTQVKKGVALLNGFVSYASTYQDKPDATNNDKTEAEREKLRHDERKKAMEELIDSTTDRSNRQGDWVVSTGVAVGFNAGRVPRNFRLDDAFWSPSLSLPLGVSIEYLPRKVLGFHAQVTLLDLGQYANINGDAQIAKPEIATAAVVGTQLGMLVGSSKYSALIGIDFGYAPALKFTDTQNPGVWRLGGFAGTYIPFLDFN
jgi:hypothetical protein